MARLSKEQMGDRGRYRFKQEEVYIQDLATDEEFSDWEKSAEKEEDRNDKLLPSVLVRTPSVGQRDALAQRLPDDEKEFTLEHTALLFSTVVVDPDLSEEEAKGFLAEWPGPALDVVIAKWVELQGTAKEMRQQAGDFRGSDE